MGVLSQINQGGTIMNSGSASPTVLSLSISKNPSNPFSCFRDLRFGRIVPRLWGGMLDSLYSIGIEKLL